MDSLIVSSLANRSDSHAASGESARRFGQEWDAAVIGGDDLAVPQLLFQALGHPCRKVSGKLRFEVPQPIFHSRLRCDKGSSPHGVKLAGKAMDRRSGKTKPPGTSSQCVTNCDRFYSGMRGHIACVWD